jgi:hypothetical protein
VRNLSLHALPAPRPGYEWVYGTVYKTDKFQNWEGNLSNAIIRGPYNVTEGPSVWHDDGKRTFKISGFVRRVEQKKSTL